MGYMYNYFESYRCPSLYQLCPHYLIYVCHSDPEGFTSRPFNYWPLEPCLVDVKLFHTLPILFEIRLLVSLLPHHDYPALPNHGVQ